MSFNYPNRMNPEFMDIAFSSFIFTSSGYDTKSSEHRQVYNKVALGSFTIVRRSWDLSPNFFKFPLPAGGSTLIVDRRKGLRFVRAEANKTLIILSIKNYANMCKGQHATFPASVRDQRVSLYMIPWLLEGQDATTDSFRHLSSPSRLLQMIGFH